MDGFKLFLESSTIHGLTYVSTTRRLARIFWVMVVLGGFSCALYLIHESFQSWTESPISTNIETLPIRKIRFPKVTVCPPKNTYTDLNYDLIMAKNIRAMDFQKCYLCSRHFIKSNNFYTKEKLSSDYLDAITTRIRNFL